MKQIIKNSINAAPKVFKKGVEKTNGKKTTSTVALLLLYEAFKLWKPDLINDSTDKIAMLTINSGLIVSLLHKAWRSYGIKAYNHIKNKLKSLRSDEL